MSDGLPPKIAEMIQVMRRAGVDLNTQLLLLRLAIQHGHQRAHDAMIAVSVEWQTAIDRQRSRDNAG